EYLYCLSGRGTFWMRDPAAVTAFGPGQLLFFEKGTVHACRRSSPGDPVVFLSIDTPPPAPTDTSTSTASRAGAPSGCAIPPR
ncbi:hypothetical protein CTI14_62270, partial [Methylobacterium radiotolerans]